jgi:hypothetical protein
MRSPVMATAPAVTITALVAWAAIAILAAAAAALYLLEAPSHPVPPQILDGLTSPASFGARTT